jgi:hypothetical protein
MRGIREAFTGVAGTAMGALLGAGAALRGGKVVHPHGLVFDARLDIDGGPAAPRHAELLAQPAERAARVRFSRSLGVPRPLPDLLGMSMRVPDAYGPGRSQDFLLVTSADVPVVHHIVLPAADIQQRPYTSSLPFRAGSGPLFIVGALPQVGSPRPAGADELERVRAAALTGGLRFDLAVAPVMGRFRRVGELRIRAELPESYDALRFEPWKGGGGLEPVGVLTACAATPTPSLIALGDSRDSRPGRVHGDE